jgi:hypothetical protein
MKLFNKVRMLQSPKEQIQPMNLMVQGSDVEALFNPLDPAPIMDRQLSSELLEFLVDSLNDNEKNPVTLCIKNLPLDSEMTKEAWQEVFRKRIEDAISRTQTEIALILRFGRQTLLLAAVVAIICTFFLYAAQKTEFFESLEPILNGICIIVVWVALWFPVEVLLFDWWPVRDKKKKFERILAGGVTIIP